MTTEEKTIEKPEALQEIAEVAPVAPPQPAEELEEGQIELGELIDEGEEGAEEIVETPPAEVPPAPKALETPAVAPLALATPPPPVTPAVDPQTQQYIARLEQERVQAQAQADQQTLTNFIAQRATQLEQEEGLASERAQALAQREGQLLWQQFQTERTARAREANAEAKAELAVQLAEQYKVPTKLLMSAQTPQAMKELAESLTVQGKRDAEVAFLRAEVERLKKGAVPVQKYDSGQGSVRSTGSRAERLAKYANGEALPEKEAANLFRD